MRVALSRAGLTIEREFAAFHDEGVFHSLPGTGRWDPDGERVVLTAFGRALKLIVPVEHAGHMLCYVARPALR